MTAGEEAGRWSSGSRPGCRAPHVRRQTRRTAEHDDPSEDPDYADLPGVPALERARQGRDLAATQAEIRPSARVLERADDRDRDVKRELTAAGCMLDIGEVSAS